MKGKKIQFWSVDHDSTSGTILRQEEFREIKTAPPILLTKENPFLVTIEKFTSGKPLSCEEKERLITISKIATLNLNCTRNSASLNEAINFIATKLQIAVNISRELLEALMALGMVKVHSAVGTAICLDRANPLFQWLDGITLN